FERLHFARFVILEDRTLVDGAALGRARQDLPIYLAFLGDCDGPAGGLLAEMAQRAGAGLRRIFAHCQDFAPDGDLLRWMREREQPPATQYVNWRGRTMRQIREERARPLALEDSLNSHAAALAGATPLATHNQLRRFVNAEQQAGRLTLTPPEPTPLGWRVRNLLHFVIVPLV